MTIAHTLRRVALPSVAFASVLAFAACGSPSTGSSGVTGGSGTADWNEKGPITYVQGKDTSGNVQNTIDRWNKDHPDEKVTLQELSENADEQRQQMVNNATSKGGSGYTVLSVDLVWTAEFAANGYLEELPADQLPTQGYLRSAVDSGTYFNKLYAFPATSDAAMLYYRKDLLDAAGLQPPKTWDELKAACAKVKGAVAGIDCYGGQLQKYEGLTCNIAEMVNSAGGEFLTADGKPTVNTEKAVAGVTWAVEALKDGTIPQASLTWKEEESRKAFQDGKLVFHRNWAYAYALGAKTDGSSAVAGKFGVAPIPGMSGPGVSTLGGHNMGISKFAKNKGTALAFIKWYNSPENQKLNTVATSQAPTWEALYTDPELTGKFEYLPVLQQSITTAKSRPKVVKYGDATQAIQDASYAALNGQKEPKAAMDELQTKLEGLTG
ncbi:MAG: ABC transporter substrate-binding protein [Actinomycetia bacterium]|nr:ABC transporter substrate-binding protein [Actinomycetes bacterium]